MASKTAPAAVRTDSDLPRDQGLEQSVPSATWRARRFIVANRWFNRLDNLVHALHKGFWVGFLGPDDLNAITSRRYENSQYIVSEEHIRRGLFDWEAPIVERYFRKGSRILVAAAGTGREILALRNAGFHAEGFECNLHLIRTGQSAFDALREPYPVAFSPADKVPQGPAIYEGLVVGWTAYSHIPTKTRRTQFLQALRARSLPHSPLIASFFTRNAGSRYDKIAHATAKISRVLSLAHSAGPVELGDDLHQIGYVHRFTQQEIEAELKAAGFQMLYYSADGDSGVVAALVD